EPSSGRRQAAPGASPSPWLSPFSVRRTSRSPWLASALAFSSWGGVVRASTWPQPESRGLPSASTSSSRISTRELAPSMFRAIASSAPPPAPQILVLGASELFLNLLSSFPPQRTIDFQYTAILLAAAALAAPWGTRAISRRIGPRRRLHPRAAATIVAGLILACTIGFQIVRWSTLRILADPYRASYRVTDHHRMAPRFLDAVRPGAG